MMQEWTLEHLEGEKLTKKKVAFYLYTPFCGTCQIASKMLEVIVELLPEVSFGKANLNYLPNLAKEYQIESVPCLLIFEDNELTDKIYAFHSIPHLLRCLAPPEN